MFQLSFLCFIIDFVQYFVIIIQFLKHASYLNDKHCILGVKRDVTFKKFRL